MELDSKLDSEKYGLDDQEKIVKVQQGKGGKSRRYLYLLLVITAIVAISAIIAVIALAIALGVRSSQSQSQSSSQTGGPTMSPTGGSTTVSPTDSGPSTCTTPGCVQLAAQMTAAMNQSVDPCEDFYEFSCGNWGQKNPIPPGLSAINPLLALQLRIFRYLADLGDSRTVTDLQTQNAFDLYQSCLDDKTIESLGVQPLLDVINNFLGGWPLIGIPEILPWSINSRDFFYEKTHGSTAFFNVTRFFNAVTQNRSRLTIHFEQRGFTPLYSLSPEDAETFIKTRLSLLNNSLGGSMYDDAVRNITDLDQRISDILVPPSEVPNILRGDAVPLLNESNIYTIETLQTLWPGFNWEGFINYMYNDTAEVEVPQDLEIVVTTPAYFEKLGLLLQNTDPEVIHNYAKFWFVYENLQYLNSLARLLGPPITDDTTFPGSHISCMLLAQTTLPLALARPYVMNLIPEATKEKVEMMVEFLRKSFGERINQMDWLSDFSKRSSIEKLNAITAHSAYPEELFDPGYVSQFYSSFYALSNDYFGNRLRGYELGLRLELNLTHSYDKIAWPYFAPPTLVNAFYAAFVNSLAILAAIATEPLYSADWPDYQLFGGLGMIVGHEITHGFDNEGQRYDKNGARRMMWSSESQDEFHSRLQCFINQFNQYSVMGHQVNGNRTLPENIADTGGLLTSFRAYRMRAETTPQLKLPTLPYTPEQLFFIAFGQIWCESAFHPDYYADDGVAVHSPNPARVRTVANSPEFAEVFNCPAGSPMNPTDKCTIW